MPRVVHFEIHAEEPVCAIYFYRALFGRTIGKGAGPQDGWPVATGASACIYPVSAGCACCRNTEGNRFGMMQADSSAEYGPEVTTN